MMLPVLLLQTSYMDPNAPLVPYSGIIVVGERIVKQSDRFHTHDAVGEYRMRSETDRGVVLIVNIIEFKKSPTRNGAEADSESLIHIFNEFGFKIFIYKDLDGTQFFKVLENLIASKYVKDTECFVLVLMSHGERCDGIDKVNFHDGSSCKVAEITNYFRHHNAPNLVKKPKVLIFPFCRGSIADNGYYLNNDQKVFVERDETRRTEMENGSTQPDVNKKVSTLSDMLECYASTPDFKTMRDTKDGSWYIQHLCNAMAKHAHNMDMEEILKITDSTVSKLRCDEGKLQTASFHNHGFSRKLFFNPGFPRE